MEFLPYMKGIYQPDYICRSDCQGFQDHLDSKNGNSTEPKFKCGTVIPKLNETERANMTRPQLTIRCVDGKAFGVMEDVSLASPIQVGCHCGD